MKCLAKPTLMSRIESSDPSFPLFLDPLILGLWTLIQFRLTHFYLHFISLFDLSYFNLIIPLLCFFFLPLGSTHKPNTLSFTLEPLFHFSSSSLHVGDQPIFHFSSGSLLVGDQPSNFGQFFSASSSP